MRAGIARTFQNIRLFANMTALENVLVGRLQPDRVGRLLRDPPRSRVRREEADSRERADALLEFVGLGRRPSSRRNLSYGEQRRLEIARALASDPGCSCSTSPPPA